MGIERQGTPDHKFQYNGKEKQTELGLGWTDYGWRNYDTALGRWHSVDPLAEDYLSFSPYHYAGNNPILNIDVDGRYFDWYKDANNTMQYDPSVQNQGDLDKKGIKGEYVGDTHSEATDRGSVSYRSDGSIMYTNETDAYNRIWNNSVATDREEMGVIMNEGVLVLPDYKNDSRTSETEAYGYTFKDGKMFDAVTEKSSSIIATIHTHPDKTSDATPSYYTSSGYGDLGFATKSTPNKWALVMGHNKQLYGVSGRWETNNIKDMKRTTVNFRNVDNVGVPQLLQGYKLTNLLRIYKTNF